MLQFDLAGRAFALPLAEISEIVPMARLSRPPGSPPILEGILNMGGVSIPVVRLAQLFSLRQSPIELYTPLVVLRSKEMPVALLVEKVNEILSVSEDDLTPVSDRHSFLGCVEAIFSMRGTDFHLLSIRQLLLREESERLAHFAAIEAERMNRLALETE